MAKVSKIFRKALLVAGLVLLITGVVVYIIGLNKHVRVCGVCAGDDEMFLGSDIMLAGVITSLIVGGAPDG